MMRLGANFEVLAFPPSTVLLRPKILRNTSEILQALDSHVCHDLYRRPS